MATPPKVQTIAEAMAELNPAYAAQEAVIGKRQEGLGAKYDAQRAGITAEKGQGFNAINNQATGRGLSFSGIPLDEQATYLSTKYLPGLQQADYQQNDEDLNLQGQLAEFGTQKATAALGRVDKQTSDLNSWNMQQESLAAQAEQNRLQREASARENELNRAASARESAANRAESAASRTAAAAPPTVNQYLQAAFSENYAGANQSNGWTEKVLAGNLASAYGISRADALKLAYSYRKQYYGQ